MTPRVAVIGAGMGGLTAAIRLAQSGLDVTVFEAANVAGGLARAFQADDYVFDSGPYILLDRPGLQWIYQTLGLDISDLKLQLVDPVYEVSFPDGRSLRFHHSVKETAAEFEQHWNGAGAKYTNYVEAMVRRQNCLRPHLYVSRPRLRDIVKNASWKQIPFLFRSLEAVLSDFDLPLPARNAISIWTHVAGQNVSTAPSPMAFVPALFHGEGAFYPRDGIRSIPAHLAGIAEKAGVEFRWNQRVAKLASIGRRVTGLIVEQQGFEAFDAVLSNAGGLNTYFRLLEEPPPRLKQQLLKMPRQSPGICIYLALKPCTLNPYLRFFLPDDHQLCRLFVGPTNTERATARLIIPMEYQAAQNMSSDEMNGLATQYLNESWWKNGIADYHVVAIRTPRDWGSDFYLYENSMNPVMTGASFRYGRLSHRSPWFDRLYFAGSSTHPGQWVSFCGISGIIAADLLFRDLS